MLISKHSKHYFFEIYILIAIDLFSVVISNESTIHFSYFQLKSILYKSTSDEIIVFPLETLNVASEFVDWIVFV